MKKILLTLAGCAFYALGISAQSFIGTWKTDEITSGDTKGFVSLVFKPQSKVTEVFDVFVDAGEGVKAKIRCEVPGLYLIESGKSMTVILDRNKAAVTGHEFDYGNFFATNGITGAKIDEFKKTVENLWNTRLKPQMEPMVVKIMPFSHIGQLLYCDGETFLIASPQSDLWNDRYEFHRVNTDAQSELHRVDWVTTNDL